MWYSPAQRVASTIAMLVIAILVVVAIAFVITSCKESPRLITAAEAQAETIISWSTVSTETIGSEGRHLVSDFWYDSGAQSAGFNLDAYTLAVESLNPGVNLTPLQDGWELRFPMDVK